jgi:translation initiation factor 5A
MSDEVEKFEAVDAGSSKTYPQQAGTIRKGGHVMIKDRPCKVIDISTSKTGKHGHAKANIVAVDIFTGRKYEDVCPTSHNLDVPIVSRKEYQLIDVSSDGFVSLLTEDGNAKDDLKMPEGDFGAQIRADFDAGKDILVTVQAACDEEQIVSHKCINASS